MSPVSATPYHRRRAWLAPLLLSLAACVLLVAIALVIWPKHTNSRSYVGAFSALLPTAVETPGWHVSQRPIAETEEMKRAVAELLNFDAAAFTIYTAGDLRVAIYAAYWVPGRMSHRLIASHTPDVCWTGNGWTCVARSVENVVMLGGRNLPLEYRFFTHGTSTPEYVAFCHFVDGQVMTYATGREPPWYAMVIDVFKHGLAQRGEQLFVRISSNRPLADFSRCEPVQIFLKRLASFPPAKPGDV